MLPHTFMLLHKILCWRNVGVKSRWNLIWTHKSDPAIEQILILFTNCYKIKIRRLENYKITKSQLGQSPTATISNVARRRADKDAFN